MNAKRSVLHIGYPKTATTSLQRNFMAKLPDTALIGELPDRADSPLDFKISPTGRPAQDSANLGIPDPAVGTHVCLSDELILGANRRLSEQAFIADYLGEMFPGSDILITIRTQEDILRSLYCSAHALRIGAFGVNLNLALRVISDKSLNFDDWVNLLLEEESETWAGLLRYDAVARIWMNQFGAERVHILPYEIIRNAPEDLDPLMSELFPQSDERFSKAITGQRFRDRRRQSNEGFAKRRKRLSQAVRLRLNMRTGPLDPSMATLRPETAERIRDTYRTTNRATGALCRFDLTALGYAT